ncbi:hypothetical protein Tco_1565648 [Tanacetum coccineum]
MATSAGNINVSQPQIPIFKGDSYEFWSIKMKTLFRSQDLWDHIENNVESSNEAQTKEYEKKDAKALVFIQQAVDESIFFKNCISNYNQAGMDYSQHRVSRLFQSNHRQIVVTKTGV